MKHSLSPVRTISASFPLASAARIFDAARRLDISASALVRDAVEEYLNTRALGISLLGADSPDVARVTALAETAMDSRHTLPPLDALRGLDAAIAELANHKAAFVDAACRAPSRSREHQRLIASLRTARMHLASATDKVLDLSDAIAP